MARESSRLRVADHTTDRVMGVVVIPRFELTVSVAVWLGGDSDSPAVLAVTMIIWLLPGCIVPWLMSNDNQGFPPTSALQLIARPLFVFTTTVCKDAVLPCVSVPKSNSCGLTTGIFGPPM